jgi:hypothetical protein
MRANDAREDYNGFMKTLFSFFAAVILISAPVRADSPMDKRLCDQINQVIRECSRLKTGVTRGEFQVIFPGEDGGLRSGYGEGSFLYKTCPYIKVEVTWNMVDPTQKTESPKDTIKTISKPYLEYPFTD